MSHYISFWYSLLAHTQCRHEASIAIAITDHRGDDRQLNFFVGDQISIKVLLFPPFLSIVLIRYNIQTRNSEKWYTGKVHNRYGLVPADKVNVVLKNEVPVKNPSVNYRYLRDSLTLVCPYLFVLLGLTLF